ncbi:MAG: TonB-dependent receptor [Bacteroidetes bacterium B1(2017)]|nr:MAG: TonB-dependent receptor [Cytophagaceae bacterium BCCC1]OYU92842.1 MAG: TonB-dependent receptor [Bacteroidetes bacterium B1(2017)]
MFLEANTEILNALEITAKANNLSENLEKKTYSIKDNITQSGGSVLQALQNLPSITVQDGTIKLRGNDKVAILIDGKQTALTGFGNPTALDNLPASAIEKIEIINNPSAKFDANGNAGIINIIYKKNVEEGFNGKLGLISGLGALWVRKANLPTIRPQYKATPKINPSLSLSYRKNRINMYLQGDYLYTETLNKNEFVNRTYDSGDIITSQLKRNRNTHFTTTKTGLDFNINSQNTLTFSGLFGTEKIIDRGDQPFFDGITENRIRLWQFLEDELKTTVMLSSNYQYKFSQPGRVFNTGFNYTFHREDEKYFYDNIVASSNGTDAFKLLSDEQVFDFNMDYVQPLSYGRVEAGLKLRKRDIPTNMLFIPGTNSVLDVNAGGEATYSELIPALYGNYVYENQNWEAEIGLRYEYVKLNYEVNPKHNTYKSDGYNYSQPFPNFRVAYKLNEDTKLSLFFNRRVDRPNEVDIRIFPKYDDAEIIKVGNPALKPQFTNSLELGFKRHWASGSFYQAIYHKFSNGTITRLATTGPSSNIIYAVFHNADKSYNSGLEWVFSQEMSKKYNFNINANVYKNQINAFTVANKYPVAQTLSVARQEAFTGNIKLNNTFKFVKKLDFQLSAIYLAPDIIPQGKIRARFSVDFGLKKAIQNQKGDIFLNGSDIFNTLVIKKEIQGQGFKYLSDDYYETQVFRLGYSLKFD